VTQQDGRAGVELTAEERAAWWRRRKDAVERRLQEEYAAWWRLILPAQGERQEDAAQGERREGGQ
jgi:hypothetical protein